MTRRNIVEGEPGIFPPGIAEVMRLPSKLIKKLPDRKARRKAAAAGADDNTETPPNPES